MSKFPSSHYVSAADYFLEYADEFARAVHSVSKIAVSEAAAELYAAYNRDSRVFTCGNGGSASIANHLACDHVKGIRSGTRLLPHVTSLTGNTELITAVANDLSYEDVFTFQLESLASVGDVLIAISSSGQSANVCNALRWARKNGLVTIALTGFTGGEAYTLADFPLHVDSDNYGVVEDVHQALAHALAQFVRQFHMDAHTVANTVF